MQCPLSFVTQAHVQNLSSHRIYKTCRVSLGRVLVYVVVISSISCAGLFWQLIVSCDSCEIQRRYCISTVLVSLLLGAPWLFLWLFISAESLIDSLQRVLFSWWTLLGSVKSCFVTSYRAAQSGNLYIMKVTEKKVLIFFQLRCLK